MCSKSSITKMQCHPTQLSLLAVSPRVAGGDAPAGRFDLPGQFGPRALGSPLGGGRLWAPALWGTAESWRNSKQRGRRSWSVRVCMFFFFLWGGWRGLSNDCAVVCVDFVVFVSLKRW